MNSDSEATATAQSIEANMAGGGNGSEMYVYQRDHIVIIDISFILRCSKASDLLQFYIFLSLVRE